LATVVVTETARLDLDALILSHGLPASTRDRVRVALRPVAEFPNIGQALTGRWQGLRFVLGPWPWMLIVYVFDESTNQVAVITIQDSRSARAATTRD
jgi:plasmid stabilization system protein ParE